MCTCGHVGRRIMTGEPDHFLDAMRVRVSGPAQRMLLQLADRIGPLDLVHRAKGDAGGVVDWTVAGRCNDSPLVSWAWTEAGTLFVHPAEIPELQQVQLVLEVESVDGSSGNEGREDRLVTLFRPYTESEQDFIEFVMRRRAQSEAHELLSRLAPPG
jgi:hypothetical protein